MAILMPDTKVSLRERMATKEAATVDAPATAPAPPKFDHETLNAASHHLLTQLLPVVHKMYQEQAAYFRVPLWVLVTGHLKNIYETGRIGGLYLEPAWSSNLPSMQRPERVCEECGKKFKPGVFGQRFCSNQCGQMVIDRANELRKQQDAASPEA